jgi:two-component system C4-dicarboxylate transport sensor histidine kinase DctB
MELTGPSGGAAGGVAPPIEWLERVNRLSLLSQLVASTLHDMNNALQVVGGGLELLHLQSVDLPAVSRAIGGKTDRMNALLQDLSRFMRDAGDAPEPVELRALAEQALALRQFAMARLRVTRSADGDPIVVPAVRREVLQVLLNLLVNAETALKGVSGPTLRIVVSGTPGGATLSVEDNGPGVPAERSARLFEQGCCWPTAPVEHLGIGLAVSRALAERRGGSLTYAPRQPGALFTLALRA